MRPYKDSTAYRGAIALAFVSILILAWLSLGVGIIGKDGGPANMMYFGVIGIGFIGAAIVRLRPRGMANTMLFMALGQALVAAIALIFRLGLPWSPPAELLALNGFFIAMFAMSAWLFQRTA